MATIESRNVITSIPQIGYYDDNQAFISLSQAETDFVKRKLLGSEEKRGIVRILRGEGRRDIIDRYINNSSIFFMYGLKSQHAIFNSSSLTEILKPITNLSQGDIIRLLPTLINELRRQHDNKRSPIYLSNDIEDKLRRFVWENDDMQFVKDFFVSILHTSGGAREFGMVTPWLSCSYGARKFDTTRNFAKGKERTKDYVLIDYWTKRNQRKTPSTYYLTKDIIKRLRLFSIEWYPDYHNEIMIRYGMFPQNIVGYYVYKNDRIHSYVVNKHYLQLWRTHEAFDIGKNVFINQSDVRIENAEGLFWRIYCINENQQIEIFQEKDGTQ